MNVFLIIFQGSFLHQNHGCWTTVFGQQGVGPHPEPDRLLPHEHPHHAALDLPVSPRRKRTQCQRSNRRRLWSDTKWQRGTSKEKKQQEVKVVCISFKTNSSFLCTVCKEAEPVHPDAEHSRPEGVDQSDEEDHPDGRGPQRSLRAVEGPQRDRCCKQSSGPH